MPPHRLAEQLVIKEHDFINSGNDLPGMRVVARYQKTPEG